MAGASKDWPLGAEQPQKAARQGSQAVESGSLCGVHAGHTFVTRLGAAGCDVWTLARIAGHSSIGISARYIHPSEDAVLTAMSRLGGHNSGPLAVNLFLATSLRIQKVKTDHCDA